MRIVTSIAVFASLTFSLAGKVSVEGLFEQGLEAERLLQPEQALVHFRAVDVVRPNDPVVLQKIAKQLSDLTFLAPDLSRKQEFAEEALVYAERAYELDSASAEIVLSLAIVHGKLGMYGGAGDKVLHARAIKEFADRALELDADYAWAHHVLGQWHIAVAELGGAKRLFASMLFGGLPKGDREQGIRHLERAVELEPDEVTHHVELGFAYADFGEEEAAREQWQRALELPNHGLEDGAAKKRAAEALAAGEEIQAAA